MKKATLLLLIALSSNKSFANDSGYRNISELVVLENGFQVHTIGGMNACTPGPRNRWFVDKVTHSEKSYNELYAGMLAALHNNREVRIIGDNECKGTTRENVHYVFFR